MSAERAARAALLERWQTEGDIAHIHGWDFSHIEGRYTEETDLPWSYEQTVRRYLTPEARLLDVDTGIVTTQGADLMEHRFLLHPTTGLTIPGFQVPQWEQVRRTVEEAVTLVPNAIIVGWDVAVTAQGPVLIEGNAYPSVQIMQTAGMQGLKRLWNSALRG